MYKEKKNKIVIKYKKFSKYFIIINNIIKIGNISLKQNILDNKQKNF